MRLCLCVCVCARVLGYDRPCVLVAECVRMCVSVCVWLPTFLCVCWVVVCVCVCMRVDLFDCEHGCLLSFVCCCVLVMCSLERVCVVVG